MYGLIGRMTAVTGQREALIGVLLHAVSGLPGCLSYIIARDPSNEDSVWITEVWIDTLSHQAALSLPAVKQALEQGRPLIASMYSHMITNLWAVMVCTNPSVNSSVDVIKAACKPLQAAFVWFKPFYRIHQSGWHSLVAW